jgi:hypothetical protein
VELPSIPIHPTKARLARIPDSFNGVVVEDYTQPQLETDWRRHHHTPHLTSHQSHVDRHTSVIFINLSLTRVEDYTHVFIDFPPT